MLDMQLGPRSGDWPAVLVVHNKYRQPGGEDAVVSAEIDLLRSTGARVETLIYDSGDTAKMRQLKQRPDQLIFNRDVYHEARTLIREQGIQIVHCHNLVPLLSTSIYSAAKAERVPIIQTLHNYRMGCLNSLYLRHGEICQRCRPGHYAAGIALGCYRGSHVQSLALGIVQTLNHQRGVWNQPTMYVVPGQFLGKKLITWGIPEDKIVVKPHFVPRDPSERLKEGDYALFVGRLSPEKGLDLLLDVWRPDQLPLVLVGDGPLRAHLEHRVKRLGLLNVHFAGQQDRDRVAGFLSGARFLIFPSTCFETFGLALIEAYAHGVPVIATRLGAMADVVRDGVTGLLFTMNDRADLLAKLAALENDPARRSAMGHAARAEYETLYSAQANAEQLYTTYTRAIDIVGRH